MPPLARPATPGEARLRIQYLLLHAYGVGGTIRTVFNQANAMAAAGHEVSIASVVRRKDEPRFPLDPRVELLTLNDQRSGVPADSLPRRAWRRMRGKIVPLGEFAASYFTERVEKAVIDHVAALDGGVLVTTRPALNLIAARRAAPGVRKVAQEHMNLATHRDTVRREIARHYHAFDAVVVLTETDRRAYERLLPGVPVVRIPNAVDVRGREPSRQENPIVVAAGRLVRQKGFDLLVPAFAEVARRHPDWRLRIYGTGPKKAELAGLISAHGLQDVVTLMGHSTGFDEALSEASIFALSSRFEGLPMVMIEAMAHALPVVAFDCPTGPADVITHGVDGLLAGREDVAGLAAALDRLITDTALRRRMSTAARLAVQDYSPEIVMPRWEALFRGL
ncbi:hypothetical protein Sme01_51460 [Sphaerisporangium melleum]|uniref:Glycosyltransferase family 4 protein n=1 Tax=Sphaerisporangium melleum TaxID=321316 RepID=A0A917QY34_9ACTN|nr:hypothetical protein GCM10007964_18220 [Sphaerisporangium melleum]GII72670.1 hypothetical protein Sme01_51460 [Sphaerisporangium melleum]